MSSIRIIADAACRRYICLDDTDLGNKCEESSFLSSDINGTIKFSIICSQQVGQINNERGFREYISSTILLRYSIFT